jgi:hypothetical protein
MNVYRNPSAEKGQHYTAPRRPRPGNTNAPLPRQRPPARKPAQPLAPKPAQRPAQPPARPAPSLYEHRLEKAVSRLNKLTWLLGDDNPKRPEGNARRAATIARVGRLALAEEKYGLQTFLIPRLRRAIRDQWVPCEAAQVAYAEVVRLTAALEATADRDARLEVYAKLFAAYDALDVAADLTVTLPPAA